MASIALKHVTKSFGPMTAIKDVSIEVPDRAFLVLLGPSGCGKSTLLRMLAGLETVTSGEIALDGRRVDQLPPSERDMAFVFQSYALYPHMSVRRNITFPLLMRRHRWWHHIPILGHVAKRAIENDPAVRDLVDRTARILALTPMMDRLPRTLSGGQRQRVALGRAMVRQPQVFLMDEPLSNLDAKLRTSMRAEITKLHREVGGTFVYVTHDQVEAMTMGTMIALMQNGVVQQIGTAREIYTDPANVYVARFIGTPAMNLLSASVRAGRVSIGPLDLPLPASLAALDGMTPRSIVIGVRPGFMRLVEPTAAGAIAGTVVLVEHVGTESVVVVRPTTSVGFAETAGEPDDASGDVTAVVPGYVDLAMGKPVGLVPDLGECVAFSPETRERIGRA